MSETADELTSAVSYLRAPSTIRLRCSMILNRAKEGTLKHFALDWSALDKAVDLVEEVTRANYPDLKIPYHSRWQHFQVGRRDRIGLLKARLADEEPAEALRSLYDLVIVSVLLDAGAGATWCYRDEISHGTFRRSEGLAVASFNMFWSGFFAQSEHHPLSVDARRLTAITERELADAMQVSADNPLVGMGGRVGLLNRLGEVILAKERYFTGVQPRLGNIVDYIQSQGSDKKVEVEQIFAAILEAFADIWPGRESIGDANLGDVWRHSAIETRDVTSGLIPFHKLSQWLTYSLVEPLEWHGYQVEGLTSLTGLPEYRNGGLFLDAGVLQLKDPARLSARHDPKSELIVEWRALTVALLDELGDRLRQRLGLSEDEFPLAKVLQGGTWSAGRKLASDLRAGEPPLNITSDGTVF